MVLTIKDFVKEPRTPRSRALWQKQQMHLKMSSSCNRMMTKEGEGPGKDVASASVPVPASLSASRKEERMDTDMDMDPEQEIGIKASLTTATTKTETETTGRHRHTAATAAAAATSMSLSSSSSTHSSCRHTSSRTSRACPTNDDILLLHDLIVHRQHSQAMERLLLAPNEASMVNNNDSSNNDSSNNNNLALHEACNHQAPLELIEALLQANPSALQTPGHCGYLPLHFAICSRAPVEVVAKLLEAYPEGAAAATSADNSNNMTSTPLPLYLAVKWGASREVLLLLLTVYPEAALQHDTATGMTPLELARQLVLELDQTTPVADGTSSSSSSPMAIAAQDAVYVLQVVAPLLLRMQQVAQQHLEHDYDSKLQHYLYQYQQRYQQIKSDYDQDKLQAESLEQQLRQELQQAHAQAAYYQEQQYAANDDPQDDHHTNLLMTEQLQQAREQSAFYQRQVEQLLQEQSTAMKGQQQQQQKLVVSLQRRIDELEGQLHCERSQTSNIIVTKLQQQVSQVEAQLLEKHAELQQSQTLLQQIQGLLSVQRQSFETTTKMTMTTTSVGNKDDVPSATEERQAMATVQVLQQPGGHDGERDPPPSPNNGDGNNDDGNAFFLHSSQQEYGQQRQNLHNNNGISSINITKKKTTKGRVSTPKRERHHSHYSPRKQRSNPPTNPRDIMLNVIIGGKDGLEREEHMAETRDPPPSLRNNEREKSSPRVRQQQQQQQQEPKRPLSQAEDKLERLRNAVPSPRAAKAAVASVKEWLTFETAAAASTLAAPAAELRVDAARDGGLGVLEEDDLLSRLLAPSDNSLVAAAAAALDDRNDIKANTRLSATHYSQPIFIDEEHHSKSQTAMSSSQSRDRVHDAYRHYKQEYESLLSRSKSNLRRRMMESSSSSTSTRKKLNQQQQQDGDTLDQKQSHSIYSKSSWEKRAAPTRTKSSKQHRTTRKDSLDDVKPKSKGRGDTYMNAKPVEVIIERKKMSSKPPSQARVDKEKHQPSHDHAVRKDAQQQQRRRPDDEDEDEDSTLVSAMDE